MRRAPAWRPWLQPPAHCVGSSCLLAGCPCNLLRDLPARRYVVPLLWLPIAAALMWRGVALGGLSPLALPLTLVAGVLVWQLIEYSIHK